VPLTMFSTDCIVLTILSTKYIVVRLEFNNNHVQVTYDKVPIPYLGRHTLNESTKKTIV